MAKVPENQFSEMTSARIFLGWYRLVRIYPFISTKCNLWNYLLLLLLIFAINRSLCGVKSWFITRYATHESLIYMRYMNILIYTRKTIVEAKNLRLRPVYTTHNFSVVRYTDKICYQCYPFTLFSVHVFTMRLAYNMAQCYQNDCAAFCGGFSAFVV